MQLHSWMILTEACPETFVTLKGACGKTTTTKPCKTVTSVRRPRIKRQHFTQASLFIFGQRTDVMALDMNLKPQFLTKSGYYIVPSPSTVLLEGTDNEIFPKLPEKAEQLNGVHKKYMYNYFGVYHNDFMYYLACNQEIDVTKHKVNNEKLDYRRLSNTKVRL